MKKSLLTLAILFASLFSFGQIIGTASVSAGSNAFMGTIGGEKQFTLLKDKLHINPGVRFNTFMGTDLKYITAPAEYTADDKNVDTMTFAKSQVNFLNLFVRIEYDITKRIAIGFDIDLTGVSFGAEQKDVPLTQGENHQQVNYLQPPTSPSAEPTTLNALLVGDNDLGSLNSSFYASFDITDNFGVDAGLSFVFTEYTTSNEWQYGEVKNDRFRNKNAMGFVGVHYAF